MSLSDAAMAADLSTAGLSFLGRFDGEVCYPLPPNRGTASCLPEHRRFDSDPDEIVAVDDPDMPAKVNAGWWRMATEYGLFDERREFLLIVDYSDPDDAGSEHAWVHVRLNDEWDLAGSGSSVLGSHFAGVFTERFIPEFSMLSLDQRMILNTTVWGNGTVSTIVVRPDRLADSIE